MFGPEVTGVGLSLAAALCWAASPMFFAPAGRRIGSRHVVLLRSMLASLVFVVLLVPYGLAAGWPALPSGRQVGWLLVSAAAGMTLGDLLIYESWVLLGARRGTQIRTLAPVASAVLAWLWLGEQLSWWTLGGMTFVLVGTSYAVLARQSPEGAAREPGSVSVMGLLFAAGGAVCEGIGAVTVRQAFKVGPGSLDPILATAIRVGSAAVFLWFLPVVRGQAWRTWRHLRDRWVLSRVLPGTASGPVIGMLCYIVALKALKAGVVSTLTATSPLFVLPMVALRYRARIGWDVIIASIVAVGGVAVICLR